MGSVDKGPAKLLHGKADGVLGDCALLAAGGMRSIVNANQKRAAGTKPSGIAWFAIRSVGFAGPPRRACTRVLTAGPSIRLVADRCRAIRRFLPADLVRRGLQRPRWATGILRWPQNRARSPTPGFSCWRRGRVAEKPCSVSRARRGDKNRRPWYASLRHGRGQLSTTRPTPFRNINTVEELNKS